MASVSTSGDGLRRIIFAGIDGARRAIYLGRMTAKDAEMIRVKVEALVSAKIHGTSPDDEVSRWVSTRSDALHNKLAAVGLVKAREFSGTTLRQLCDAFFAHLNVKPITLKNYLPTRAAMEAYFGADTAIRDIEPLAADQWRAAMKADGLAEATIAKRVKLARQIFRRGIKWRMLVENPFAEVKVGSQKNKARQRFIPLADAQRVLDACPDDQWRLLFALSRFGGLRCPSEHLALKWSDIDWERGQIRVTCSKTEAHEGKAERFTPLFPELRPYLLDTFERAEPGSEWVITRYRDTNSNLRTHMCRIIRKAGLTPWPRLFHNLRSSRQTELSERFSAHVVCSWLGNSERVAQAHYLQVTDAHLAAALAEPTPAETKTTRNPTRNTSQQGETSSNGENPIKEKTPLIPGLSVRCGSVPIPQVEGRQLASEWLFEQ